MNHIASILILAAFAPSIHAATLPTLDDLTSALANAVQEWKSSGSETIEFRFDALNSCELKENPTIAQTQPYDTVTTMSFDDGSEPVVSHKMVWLIRINSNCDWSRLNLRNTIMHELGHILVSPNYHSTNKASIMYWVVRGNQSILPEDRAMLKTEMSRR